MQTCAYPPSAEQLARSGDRVDRLPFLSASTMSSAVVDAKTSAVALNKAWRLFFVSDLVLWCQQHANPLVRQVATIKPHSARVERLVKIGTPLPLPSEMNAVRRVDDDDVISSEDDDDSSDEDYQDEPLVQTRSLGSNSNVSRSSRASVKRSTTAPSTVKGNISVPKVETKRKVVPKEGEPTPPPKAAKRVEGASPASASGVFNWPENATRLLKIVCAEFPRDKFPGDTRFHFISNVMKERISDKRMRVHLTAEQCRRGEQMTLQSPPSQPCPQPQPQINIGAGVCPAGSPQTHSPKVMSQEKIKTDQIKTDHPKPPVSSPSLSILSPTPAAVTVAAPANAAAAAAKPLPLLQDVGNMEANKAITSPLPSPSPTSPATIKPPVVLAAAVDPAMGSSLDHDMSPSPRVITNASPLPNPLPNPQSMSRQVSTVSSSTAPAPMHVLPFASSSRSGSDGGEGASSRDLFVWFTFWLKQVKCVDLKVTEEQFARVIGLLRAPLRARLEFKDMYVLASMCRDLHAHQDQEAVAAAAAAQGGTVPPRIIDVGMLASFVLNLKENSLIKRANSAPPMMIDMRSQGFRLILAVSGGKLSPDLVSRQHSRLNTMLLGVLAPYTNHPDTILSLLLNAWATNKLDKSTALTGDDLVMAALAM